MKTVRRNKPYLECPNCGHTEISLWRRSTAIRSGLATFWCHNCGKRFHIPSWCRTIELICSIIGIAIAYKIFNAYGNTVYVIAGILGAYLMLFISGSILSLFVPMKPGTHDFDYGDYSMVSRHKGNADVENTNSNESEEQE